MASQQRPSLSDDAPIISRLLDDFIQSIYSLIDFVPLLYAGGPQSQAGEDSVTGEAFTEARAALLVVRRMLKSYGSELRGYADAHARCLTETADLLARLDRLESSIGRLRVFRSISDSEVDVSLQQTEELFWQIDDGVRRLAELSKLRLNGDERREKRRDAVADLLRSFPAIFRHQRHKHPDS